MDVGFERAGVEVVFANKLMKEAAQAYIAIRPNANMVNADTKNVIDRLYSSL